MDRFRVGADIGGTFTDIVFLALDGALEMRKVLSTPADFGRAIVEALARFLAGHALAPAAIAEVAHGTTVATNAILEKKGARVGLLTTEGFRDVLEIRRVRLPKLYDITWEKPEPLVPRELRLEVGERIGAGGVVRKTLDVESARRAIARLERLGVESLAVCFLHSYANPTHERAVGALAQDATPFVSLSCEVLPELREYERTATTVVDAYVKPVVNRYLRRLRQSLDRIGIGAPVLVMQSNGGIISDARAAEWPVHVIESGPAAGVIAAAATAGRRDLITLDMGGTTAKASIVESGAPHMAAEYEIGGAISQGSRLIKGSGYLLRIPAIDIAEVGAGGGSIAWIDAGGVLRVGPQSAGADPGPASYGRGGELPTVTDANIVLGYLNPEYLVGGDLTLDAACAEEVIRKHIADPLGLSVLEAAEGIHAVVNATMHRAIRSVTIERGRDPRDFTLIAFGGNGPVHAAGLAADLDIPAILIPPHPGLFSSLGLLVAEVEHLYSRSLLTDVRKLAVATAEAVLEEMAERARQDFAAEGFAEGRVQLSRSADVRYWKQISELNLPLPEQPLTDGDLAALGTAFEAEHRRTYGYAIEDERVEVVALKVRARGLRPETAPIGWSRPASGRAARRGERMVYFGQGAGRLRAPVVSRDDIDERGVTGPLIIEEYDSTVVVPPSVRVRREPNNFLLLER